VARETQGWKRGKAKAGKQTWGSKRSTCRALISRAYGGSTTWTQYPERLAQPEKEMNESSNIDQLESKIFWDGAALRQQLADLQQRGQKIVFTNGCFDILHRGHVEYLCRARDLGDFLVLGLNSDDSVRELKGPGRPIQPMEDRIRILAGLFCLDFLIPFSESTPEALLSILKPDIHTKGGDYKPEALPEAAVVQSYGGQVIILPFLEGRSSSKIIERSRLKPESERN
tara:strand:- start:19780 stop:20463 length:684 start_codon:yes stop_codon:yes gene_type:complete